MGCKNCGKKTKKWGNHYTKYCDTKCRDKYFSSLYEKIEFEPVDCERCGIKFTPKTKNNRFCSDLCANRQRQNSKKPRTKKCKHCNKEFEPYTSLDKFCSSNCRIENVKSGRSRRWSDDKAKRITGKNNPAYRNGLSTRTKLAKRDSTGERLFRKVRDEKRQEMLDEFGYLFCERCFCSGDRWEMHHIIFRSEKPKHEYIHDKRNLINVCVKCHNEFHKNKALRNDIVVERGLDLLFGNDVLDK